jgi:glycosyltransferase involved in cell wall biosynthesis
MKNIYDIAEKYIYFAKDLQSKLSANDKGAILQAWLRCWQLKRLDINLYNLFLRLERQFADPNLSKRVHKEMALHMLSVGEMDNAIKCLDFWQNTSSRIIFKEDFSLDYEIFREIDLALSNDRKNCNILDKVKSSDKKRRILHLTYGITQFNSVLIKIALTFAKHHDHSTFDVSCVALNTWQEIEASRQGIENLELFEQNKCPVILLPSRRDKYTSLLDLANAILNDPPDLIISHASCADFSHHIFLSLLRGIPIVGVISGPLGQFFSPALTTSITWNRHLQLDTPLNCQHFNLEVDSECYPAGDDSSPVNLGVPAGNPVLMSAGRALKFNSAFFWRLVELVLSARPDVHFVCVGPRGSETYVPKNIAESNRVRFVPWTDRYHSILRCADVLLDTFPSGGGVTLLDAAKNGIPIVGFYNDYERIHSQEQWGLLEEYSPADYDLIFEHTDIESAAKAVLALLSNDELKHQKGAVLRQHFIENFGSPSRMVKSVENFILEKIIK